MEPDFYTVKEIAEKLRVKISTVQDYIRKGHLPAYRIGRDYRIKKDDYEEWLKKRRTTWAVDEPDGLISPLYKIFGDFVYYTFQLALQLNPFYWQLYFAR